MFADEAKLLRRIRNHKDCEELQNDTNNIYKWNTTWEMEINAKKYHILEIGKSAECNNILFKKKIIPLKIKR